MFPVESRRALASGGAAPVVAPCEPPHPDTIATAAQRLTAQLLKRKWLDFIFLPL
jgi:hypothetical protein